MSSATRTFARHYLEMILAMFIGMAVLGGALSVFVEIEDTALMLAWMAFTMTAPMVGWMRYRGHGWTPCVEMGASMVLPSVLAIGLFWAGAVEDDGALMAIQHVVMFPAMLGAMLLRRDEYSGHAHHAHA